MRTIRSCAGHFISFVPQDPDIGISKTCRHSFVVVGKNWFNRKPHKAAQELQRFFQHSGKNRLYDQLPIKSTKELQAFALGS